MDRWRCLLHCCEKHRYQLASEMHCYHHALLGRYQALCTPCWPALPTYTLLPTNGDAVVSAVQTVNNLVPWQNATVRQLAQLIIFCLQCMTVHLNTIYGKHTEGTTGM